MKLRRWFVHSLTGVLLSVILSCAGCGSGVSDTVTVDAGEFTVTDVNQLTPGDVPAMQKLSAEIKSNPEAATYVVKWKNVHGLGDTFRRQYIFDRKAGTLTDDHNRTMVYYEAVTADHIHSLAQSSSTADGLPALGARKVDRLPEPSS